MREFKPIELSRKEKIKCTYYELYSLKNKRNIHLYSQHCYYQSLILEMDNNVKSYCERPLILDDTSDDPSKIIDFIVEYSSSNILEMQRINYHRGNMVSAIPNQNIIYEQNWCQTKGYEYKVITFDKLITNSYYLQNIKYLYGLIKRNNSIISNNYLKHFIQSLIRNKSIHIYDLMNEYKLSAYNAIQAVALGFYNGILSLQLEGEVITINTEVRLKLNEICL